MEALLVLVVDYLLRPIIVRLERLGAKKDGSLLVSCFPECLLLSHMIAIGVVGVFSNASR